MVAAIIIPRIMNKTIKATSLSGREVLLLLGCGMGVVVMLGECVVFAGVVEFGEVVVEFISVGMKVVFKTGIIVVFPKPNLKKTLIF